VFALPSAAVRYIGAGNQPTKPEIGNPIIGPI
jgi:hypothetical protein